MYRLHIVFNRTPACFSEIPDESFPKFTNWCHPNSLCSCLSICKSNYLLHTVTQGLLDDVLSKFYMSIRHSLEVITCSSIQDYSWLLATLSIRNSGLGLQDALISSAAAFIGSYNTTRYLTQGFLWQANESLTSTDSLSSTYWDLPESVTTCTCTVPYWEKTKHKIISTNNLGWAFWLSILLWLHNVRFSFMSIPLYNCLSKRNLVLEIKQGRTLLLPLMLEIGCGQYPTNTLASTCL